MTSGSQTTIDEVEEIVGERARRFGQLLEMGHPRDLAQRAQHKGGGEVWISVSSHLSGALLGFNKPAHRSKQGMGANFGGKCAPIAPEIFHDEVNALRRLLDESKPALQNRFKGGAWLQKAVREAPVA